MKKLGLLFLFCSLCTLALAQKAVTPTATDEVKDTVKSKGPHKLRLQNVGASAMSANADLVDNLSHAPDFQVFYKAIVAAEMAETLKSKGPFTVFAPDDDAFKKLSQARIDTLMLPAHKVELSNLISGHVIAGKLSIKDISKQINSGNGQAVFITLGGSKLIGRINENRNIVLTDENGNQSVISRFDIQQSNGVLHVVTSVIIPKTKAI